MGEARFEVRLKPRARGDRVSINAAGTVEVAVTSPPIDDRANEHLISLLSDCLGVSKRSIVIIKGGHSRNKVVAVTGMTKDEVLIKLKVER
jgi:uncharacterized protein